MKSTISTTNFRNAENFPCWKDFHGFQNQFSCKHRSKIAPVSSKLESCNDELEEESETPSSTSNDDDDDKEDNYKHKPKRQCFADRLKNALERGCTPETPEEHSSFDLKVQDSHSKGEN